MKLTLEAPAASYVRIRRRNGITTFDYRNRSGLLTTTQWPLIMRLESGSALEFVKEFFKKQNREALVLRDPDNCLVLTSLIDDIVGLNKTEFDANCAGLAEDETYLEVQTEKFDTFELLDNTNTGNSGIQERLIDGDCSDPSEIRNVACLRMENGQLKTVGPKTGEQVSDGFGFGADDDASGMVVMFDIGGARVFDAITFDRNPYVLRNMAGLINTVSAELLTGWRKTAITMTTHTLAGYAEPIAIFDFSVSDPQYAGYNALVRIDSGPITPFNYESDFPLNDDNSKATFNSFYDEILAKIYPTEATFRAVAVSGEAPDFIDDLNHDGKFTAADVEMAGYTLVSNEIKTKLTLTYENLAIETPNPKCPPRTVLFLDLDGDMVSGAPQKQCKGTSSSTKRRRIPR
ncbi:MAG: hypothetical protein ACR2P6_00010 [Gammaproteobacteria bacterium]